MCVWVPRERQLKPIPSLVYGEKMKKTILVVLMTFAIIVTVAPVTSDSSGATIFYYDGQWMTGWLHWGIATYDGPAVGAECVSPGPYPYEFNLSEPLHVSLQIRHWLGRPKPSEENYLTIYLDGVSILEADTIGLDWYPGGDGIELIDLGTLPAGTHFINMSATFGNYYAMDWFKVLGPAYDVAVINVVPSISEGYQAWTIQVNVTVLNNGTTTIDFNVTACYDTTKIGTKTVTNFAPGNQTTLTFDWPLTGVALGFYDIKANATLIGVDDTYLDNNECVVYDAVKVKLPGDVDGDGLVGGGDLGALGWAWGSTVGMPKYNPQCDFDQDGSIGGGDLGTLGWNWGKSVTY